MYKIKIAILGYGNLGRGVESRISQTEDMELSAVFTRRDPKEIKPVSNTPVYRMEDLKSFEDKIDVIIVCGGSAKDLPEQTPLVLSMFNCVDSFDTHSKIPEHFQRLDKVGQDSKKLCALSIGWDPGIFSMARALFSFVMPAGETYTFWGKGVSQGHSDALRRIAGVENAVQYTIPKKDALEKVRNGLNPKLSAFEKHLRECFIVAKEGVDLKTLESEIKEMPDYFKGYDTVVHFIDKEEFSKNHLNKPHGGVVIHSAVSGSDKFSMELGLNLDSNPEFTAAVLVAYARAVYRLNREGKCGAVTVLDVPLKYLSPKTDLELYKEYL